MKAVVVLMLLIATVYCLPAKRSASSSESSEERVVAQRPAPMQRKAANLIQAEPTQAPPVDSNESTDSADDTEDTDDESETDEKEEDNETDSSESNSGETVATSAPATEEPTLNPDINTGRGDSMGYPGDYKKSVAYVDAKDFEKIPSPYKSYSSDKMGGLTVVSKKMDSQNINDVEKEFKLFKALQVYDGLEEEDTSTPEIEAAPGDHDVAPVGIQDSEGASAGDSPSASASASKEETEADGSQSSEETTATPGAADSDSSQSTESQESDEDNTQTTEGPVVVAK